MTPEQKAAYINSQVACALIQMEGMRAENAQRAIEGLPPAYREDAFSRLLSFYKISHNDVMVYMIE